MTGPTLPSALPDHLGIARTRDGLMAYLRQDLYIGRSLEVYGEYCQAEADLLMQLISAGDVVVEAGANIGAHTIGIARRVGATGHVLAFEPQRLINQLLCANIVLNGLTNVDVYKEGLGAAPSWLSVPDLDITQTINFGGVSLSDRPDWPPVRVVTLDGLALPRLSLLKVDVEGMEQQVLEGGRETIMRLRPILYVENDRAVNQVSLNRMMLELGYRLWWHLPTLYSAANLNGVAENLFPSVASINVLGVPREREASIAGLHEITEETVHWQ